MTKSHFSEFISTAVEAHAVLCGVHVYAQQHWRAPGADLWDWHSAVEHARTSAPGSADLASAIFMMGVALTVPELTPDAHNTPADQDLRLRYTTSLRHLHQRLTHARGDAQETARLLDVMCRRLESCERYYAARTEDYSVPV